MWSGFQTLIDRLNTERITVKPEDIRAKFQTLIDRLNTSKKYIKIYLYTKFQTLIDRLNTLHMGAWIGSCEHFKPL